ncbi:hypothetical protein [Amycolatopsis sp. w19]|uniref:hypothetical protein n=1 Tax=Amycolatopsis sp. w19 TaxID=3448134 RepID=UPI003F1DA0DF
MADRPVSNDIGAPERPSMVPYGLRSRRLLAVVATLTVVGFWPAVHACRYLAGAVVTLT